MVISEKVHTNEYLKRDADDTRRPRLIARNFLAAFNAKMAEYESRPQAMCVDRT